MTSNYIVRALSPTGDWTFGAGLNNYLQNGAAVQQDIQTRLLEFLGECFFAISDGVDWFTFLAGSKDQTTLLLNVNAVILNTVGVTGIVNSSVNYTAQTRNISLVYAVNTIYTGAANPTGIAFAGIQFLVTQSGIILTTQSGEGILA